MHEDFVESKDTAPPRTRAADYPRCVKVTEPPQAVDPALAPQPPRRYSLWPGLGDVHVYEPGRMEPHALGEEEACRRILSQPALLAACREALPLLTSAIECGIDDDTPDG